MSHATEMKEQYPKALGTLAGKYIWWKRPEDAMQQPERIIAQVMNIGDYNDVQFLASIVDEATLRHVVKCAEAGQFSGQSWHYWHYRLGLAAPGQVPPMPERTLR